MLTVSDVRQIVGDGEVEISRLELCAGHRLQLTAGHTREELEAYEHRLATAALAQLPEALPKIARAFSPRGV